LPRVAQQPHQVASAPSFLPVKLKAALFKGISERRDLLAGQRHHDFPLEISTLQIRVLRFDAAIHLSKPAVKASLCRCQQISRRTSGLLRRQSRNVYAPFVNPTRKFDDGDDWTRPVRSSEGASGDDA
jgi:hypothetical protein